MFVCGRLLGYLVAPGTRGAKVGSCEEGIDVGYPVGAIEDEPGLKLDIVLGWEVGDALGRAVGVPVGLELGEELGIALGWEVGDTLGPAVGVAVGVALGAALGVALGWEVGEAVRQNVGHLLGGVVGRVVWMKGKLVGNLVGVFVPTRVGLPVGS